MENVVSVEGVWKIFGRTIALSNVSLRVPKGCLFLLMGPNGSGKSTLLKIITGLIKPTQGKIKVFGMDPWKQRQKIFARVGAMFEDHAPPDWASGKAYLQYKATLKKIENPEKEALAVAELFKLNSFWEYPIFTYSSGMKRKLALADAFINNPDLVILDDPTVALDKEARITLQQIVADRTEQNKTCIIASHIITEFENHATYLAVLNLGQVMVAGKIEDIMDTMELRQITIKTNQPETAANILMKKGYPIKVYGNSITVERAEDSNRIITMLEKLGIKAEVEETKASLWEMYARALTSR
ncbi:MAG: ABC transporter ATP-binding protein [Candidatus Bathyarchaeota archaeon]|jgi:ABC-2 type transport system ATP-binding protein|nr:ABC transporter ATP-binding protein [Candidatus Bathyarchaeota archaeon]